MNLPKPPSRHLNTTQRAGLGVVLLALVTLAADVTGHTPSSGVIDILKAAIYSLGAIGGGMGTMSAGRDVAKEWRKPQPAEDNDLPSMPD